MVVDVGDRCDTPFWKVRRRRGERFSRGNKERSERCNGGWTEAINWDAVTSGGGKSGRRRGGVERGLESV